ncbi:putative murein hydrolase (TIGR00659 family) [Paenibacillus phyllosphaerae]|uniref:Putative murein hydrolase (TIGR00659 family) n=1 Tax=Paenibacillus phyllosphaerae TaxID=274593 RepID=A0A7W5FLZ7_9BACL|nr:LrgB family protein [Paenibacillus phyllosphaerae]MBB3109721.1 putative murein hydrolase (TIGR00659 family) [Paenibacillus phyllosphaerae]
MMMAILSFLATIIVYTAAKKLHGMRPTIWLSPLIITPVTLVLLLLLTDTSVTTYNSGAHVLSDMLQPATIAFAVPLSRHFDVIKKHAVEIIVSVLAGSAVAILSAALIAKQLQLNEELIYSLLPHSATTPIAMTVSATIGGIPTITAVAVMLTGIFGSMIGPTIIRLCRIRSDVARGVLLGTSAHGAGTSKAFEIGSMTGTVSSIAMILSAIMTLFLAPWLLAAL